MSPSDPASHSTTDHGVGPRSGSPSEPVVLERRFGARGRRRPDGSPLRHRLVPVRLRPRRVRRRRTGDPPARSAPPSSTSPTASSPTTSVPPAHLARSVQYLAPGVIMAVVDPGVGTHRRPIAVEVGNGRAVFIGPDNGLLAPAVGLLGGATRAVVAQRRRAPARCAWHLSTDAYVFAPGPPSQATGCRSPTRRGGRHRPLFPGILPISWSRTGPWSRGCSGRPLRQRAAQRRPRRARRPGRRGNWRTGPTGSSERSGAGTSRCCSTDPRARLVVAFEGHAPGAVGLVVDSYGLIRRRPSGQRGRGPGHRHRRRRHPAPDRRSGTTPPTTPATGDGPAESVTAVRVTGRRPTPPDPAGHRRPRRCGMRRFTTITVIVLMAVTGAALLQLVVLVC